MSEGKRKHKPIQPPSPPSQTTEDMGEGSRSSVFRRLGSRGERQSFQQPHHHQQQQQQQHQQRPKSELCRNFTRHGQCNYGDKCIFIHTPLEQLPKEVQQQFLNKYQQDTAMVRKRQSVHRTVEIHDQDKEQLAARGSPRKKEKRPQPEETDADDLELKRLELKRKLKQLDQEKAAKTKRSKRSDSVSSEGEASSSAESWSDGSESPKSDRVPEPAIEKKLSSSDSKVSDRVSRKRPHTPEARGGEKRLPRSVAVVSAPRSDRDRSDRSHSRPTRENFRPPDERRESGRHDRSSSYTSRSERRPPPDNRSRPTERYERPPANAPHAPGLDPGNIPSLLNLQLSPPPHPIEIPPRREPSSRTEQFSQRRPDSNSRRPRSPERKYSAEPERQERFQHRQKFREQRDSFDRSAPATEAFREPSYSMRRTSEQRQAEYNRSVDDRADPGVFDDRRRNDSRDDRRSGGPSRDNSFNSQPPRHLQRERGDVQRERGDVQRGDMQRERGDMQRGDLPRGDMQRGDLPRGDMQRERGDMQRGDLPRGDMQRERGDMQRGDMQRGDLPRCDMQRERGDVQRERGDVQRGDLQRERGDMQRGDLQRPSNERRRRPEGPPPDRHRSMDRFRGDRDAGAESHRSSSRSRNARPAPPVVQERRRRSPQQMQQPEKSKPVERMDETAKTQDISSNDGDSDDSWDRDDGPKTPEKVVEQEKEKEIPTAEKEEAKDDDTETLPPMEMFDISTQEDTTASAASLANQSAAAPDGDDASLVAVTVDEGLEDISDDEFGDSNDKNESIRVDWAALVKCAKPKAPVASSIRQRFAPSNFLRTISFSKKFLGPELAAAIEEKCNEDLEPESTERFKFLDDSAVLHQAALVEKEVRKTLVSDVGPFRRALSARHDLRIRRRLCGLGPEIGEPIGDTEHGLSMNPALAKVSKKFMDQKLKEYDERIKMTATV